MKQARTYWETEDFATVYQMGAQKHRVYILDKLKELEVENLLDVGCGTGPIYDLIVNNEKGRWDNIKKYKGTDYSWRMIETCQKMFPGGNWDCQDARQMTEPDSSWDCVLLMHSLDHLDDYQAAIKEAIRVSKKYICICLWRSFINEGTNLNN
ncbi:MAG: class I SAM-dependent methyltransferase, partial [Nanoarchaeota archaeon]